MKSGIISSILAIVVLLTSPAVLAVDVYISEFQSVNDSTVTDSFGKYSDWIELYNATGAAVSLDGWYLTDDAADLTKWQFPAVTIQAGAYMLVFASDNDLRDPAAELHTNFKLSGSGEYIALVRPDGATVEHFFNPVPLGSDVSYGLDMFGAGVLFSTPTPGTGPGIGNTTVSPVQFSVAHGFFDAPFSLELSTPTTGALILYTLDGSDPATSGGIAYSGPIAISDTTVVRASASRNGMIASQPVTQTYLFLDSVLQQSDDQSARGLPSIWDANATVDLIGNTGVVYKSGSTILADARQRQANYAMDPDIVDNPFYGPRMIDAMTAIPSISMVMDVDDLFGPQGIYPNSVIRASAYPDWEKAASLELLDPAGVDDFNVNCGSRMMGELARYPIVNQKQSFRVVFKEEYGPTKLKTDFFGSDDGVDKYDTLVLRANWGDGWLQDEKVAEQVGVAWYGGTAYDNQYLRDIYAHDAYKATGHPGVDGRFVHLYLNGVYWGLYQVIERPDNNYAAQHFGGSSDDYDVIKGSVWDAGQGRNGIVQDGNADTWNKLMNYFDVGDPIHSGWTGQNLTDWRGNYILTTMTDQDIAEVEQYMDVDAFIDYMITLWSIDRGDFPRKNWYASCRRTGSGGGVPIERFLFFTWDSEASLNAPDGSGGAGRWYNGSSSNDTGPVRIFRRLITNENFCLRWSQRAAELLGPGGALSAEANIARYQARMDEIQLPLIGESARWGDTGGLYVDDPLTVDDDWLPEAQRILNEYFPVRNYYVIEQMREAGVYPSIDEPQFTVPGGVYDGVLSMNMVNPNGGLGTIYYTLDGSDPRMPDGSPSPTALTLSTSPIETVTALSAGGIWSYSDEGIDYGAAWRELDFDDSAWKVGQGQFGYGDGDETTPIGFGGNSADKNMTTYFRCTIDVPSAAQVTSMFVDILVDDGAIIYVNGIEARRVNMPAGAVSFDTPAASSVVRGDELMYFQYDLDPALLVDGANVIAVEVHQDSPTGSDLSFDMTVSLEAGGIGLNAIPLDFDAHAKARILYNGEWSIYAEQFFMADQDSPIEISEVYYHPEDPNASELAAGFDADDFEFIELHNTGYDQTVEFSAVLTGGVEEPVAAFTLAADEYGVIVANDEAFRMRFGDAPRILGNYSGRLSNAGEQITLLDSYGSVIVEFAYLDDAPWPLQADGYGMSLNLIDHKSLSGLPVSWMPALPTPGEASGGLVGLEGDFNGDDVVNAMDIDLLQQEIQAGTNNILLDLDGDNLVDAADLAYMLGTVLLTSNGDANLDGVVDIQDFVILKQNYGTAGGWAAGDFNGDGAIDLQDFVVIKQSYGN